MNDRMNKMKDRKKEGKISAVILATILCTVFTALGQFFLKLGTRNLSFSFHWLITNWALILGCIFYLAGAIIMIVALKHGELSFVYPLISLGFVWVALLSFFVLGESLSLLQLLGMMTIIGGVSLVGWSARGAGNG